MQHLQEEHTGELLTVQQVQLMLGVDRSTIYRMAGSGRLPALKIGRQWRIPADRMRRMLQLPEAPESATAEYADAADPARSARSASRGRHTPPPVVGSAVDAVVAASVARVAADLLGVMMVVTDMDGHPITEVANPCPWFADRADDPDLLDACTAEWQNLADDPDFEPRFAPGALGFECARAFIRRDTSLVAMVLAGGIAPPGEDADGRYVLDEQERRRVLRALPRVAAALSEIPPREPRPRRTR